jgi:hypothetical protein
MTERRSIRDVAEIALSEVSDLVGCAPEGISGVQKKDDGWVVDVELLEVERIPQTTDVLGSYEVTVDQRGEVTGYRRLRGYVRADVEDR